MLVAAHSTSGRRSVPTGFGYAAGKSVRVRPDRVLAARLRSRSPRAIQNLAPVRYSVSRRAVEPFGDRLRPGAERSASVSTLTSG
jgi:hypothetical protein